MRTAGNVLIDSVLPEDLRGIGTIDKSSIKDLLRSVAERHPDRYKEVTHRLFEIGAFAGEAAGASLSFAGLRTPDSVRQIRGQLMEQVEAIDDDESLDPKQAAQLKIDLVGSALKDVEELLFEEAKKSGNPLAMQVASGSRGNKSQLRQILFGDGLVQDHRDEIIGLPILHGYAEGLTPAEYFAAAYGARQGVVKTKLATADAGFVAKQLAQAAHRLVVTEKDCGTASGVVRDGDDDDNVGEVLAVPVGDFPAGHIIDRNDLKKLKGERIRTRSTVTCQAPDGICSKCAGVRSRGRLPEIGDNVGVPASQAISEKVSQGMLCLAPDTLVSTPDGSSKAIGELDIGDEVVAVDKFGRNMPSKVTAVFRSDSKMLRLYRFGVVMYSMSDDHKVAVRVPWWLRPFVQQKWIMLPASRAAWLHWSFRPFCGYHSCRSEPAYVLTRVGKPSPGPAVDIEIDHPDHAFLLVGGLVVSNSSKHTGGTYSKKDPTAVKGGFKQLNSLIQMSSKLEGKATLADVDGAVTSISPAPQGGHYVHVGIDEHYVPPEVEVTVKVGDKVEAGDTLSGGLPSPAEVARHKGVGEGRRVLADALGRVLKASGISSHRRNVEALARGLMDHIEITDPDGVGSYMYGDVVPYSAFASSYEPREGATERPVRDAAGQYLEQPVLHHTIGSRVTKRMLKELQDAKIESIRTHPEPPAFTTRPVRAMESAMRDENWLTRLHGSYLGKGLQEAVHRSREADTVGETSYVPGLAPATNFGDRLSLDGKY